MELKPGMLARSKAGRDKDCIYVIRSVNDEYVYLADSLEEGTRRNKKKNRKHIKVIKKTGNVKCEAHGRIKHVKS